MGQGPAPQQERVVARAHGARGCEIHAPVAGRVRCGGKFPAPDPISSGRAPHRGSGAGELQRQGFAVYQVQ
jgi:hypothetical protein